MGQKTLFENKTIEVVKDKKKGVITISPLEFDDNSEENLKNWREKNIPTPKIKGFSVDFSGHNEGSSSPCKDDEEVRKEIENLKQKYSGLYKLEIIKDEDETEETKNDEINKLIKRCEKENEPYSYSLVSYNCDVDLNGKSEYLDISDVVERRRGELGSSSGCGDWVEFRSEEDMEEFKQELLQIRKSVCDLPYTKESCVNDGGGENIFLTDIKIENTLVSFSKKAREFLERNGFSVDEFYKEFNALKQKPATKEEIKKSKTFDLMEKQKEKLRDECWAIKGYFEECSFFPKNHKGSNYHTDKIKKLGIDITDLNKLKELYLKKANTYKMLNNKIGFQRYGEKPSDDYP